MSNTQPDTESSKLDTARRYAPWVTGGLLTLMGISMVLSPAAGFLGFTRSILAGLIFLLGAAVALPPTRTRLGEYAGIEFASWMVVGIVLAAFLVGGGVMPPTPDDADDIGSENTPTPVTTEDAGDAATETVDGQGTPAVTDADSGAATATQTPSSEGPQLLASNTFPNYGMTVSMSPNGQRAAFGFHTGNFGTYDAQEDAFSRTSTEFDSQPSDLQVRDDGMAVTQWTLDNTIGEVNLFGAGGVAWSVEYSEDLWAIDADGDHAFVAATTSPVEGPGRVGVATGEGVMRWDQSLGDATGLAVAMTEDGSRMAAGVGQYSEDPSSIERVGTPGVRFYDASNGEQLWSYVTESDVYAVDIHQQQEVVVASTDDGSIVVLDFEGNVLWEVSGSDAIISGDGSTVVGIDSTTPVAYDATSGEERWRAEDAPGFPTLGRSAVSADGDRFIATEAVGWTYVVEEGEVIWEEEREDNPVNVDISVDGSTWVVIEQDNDTEEAHVFIYRAAPTDG